MTPKEIYEAIQRWLEGTVPTGSTRDILKIEYRPRVNGGPEDGILFRTLVFRRIAQMGGQMCAESVKDPRVRIAYDPNWNVIGKIEALLKEE